MKKNINHLQNLRRQRTFYSISLIMADEMLVAEEHQLQKQRHDAERERYQRTLREASHKEREERHEGRRQGVWHLGSDMVQVFTLCSCRRS